MEAAIHGESLALPVFSARREAPGRYQVAAAEVAGTCFLLGNGIFLTAGHVAHAITERDGLGLIGLATPGEPIRAAEIVESEQLPDDLALVRAQLRPGADTSRELAFPWQPATAQPLTAVHTLGYGYGAHSVRGVPMVLQRAFSGHIVSAPDEIEIASRPRHPFAAYELSFQAPRGLSGAPLLTGPPHALPGQSVIGVVIGNSTSSMLVFDSEERVREGADTTVVQRYESLSLGLAVQAGRIVEITSSLLGSTIGEFLAARGRLAGA